MRRKYRRPYTPPPRVIEERKRAREALKNAIEHELKRARGHLVTISTRKLSAWYPELRQFSLNACTRVLHELIHKEYSEFFIMEWSERKNSDKRYILARDPSEKEKILGALNPL